MIDNKLSWKAHITQLRKSCLKSLNLLKHLAHKKWGADTLLLRLYVMLIKPKMDYDVEIYSAVLPAVLERISPV